jgi:signal transduction histidine kinase
MNSRRKIFRKKNGKAPLWVITAMLLLVVVLSCQNPNPRAQETLIIDSTEASRQGMEDVYRLIAKGEESIRIHNLDSAVFAYRRALDTAVRYNNAEGIFYASISLAIGYTEFGRYEDAMSWFRHSLIWYPLTPSANRSIHGSRALNNVGNLFMYQGHYKEATEYYFRAASLVETQAHHDRQAADHLIRIYNNIGTALLYLNEYDRALYYLDKAEALAHGMQLPRQLASVLNHKARVWCRKQYPDKAWNYVQQAVSLAREHSPSLVEYTGAQTIAEILISKGEPGRAIPYLQEALNFKHYVNPYYRTGVLYTLGYSYFLEKKYTAAATYLQAACREAEAANASEYLLRSHRQLAALYTATNNCELALKHQQTAYQLNDSLLSRQKTEAVTLMEIKYRTAEKDKELIRKQLLISEQQLYLRRKNLWIYGLSGASLALTLLVFSYYRSFRHRQKVHLLKAMITGEEKERVRIGRELHDGIGGRLAAINMNFGAIQKRYASFPGKEELEQIMTMLEETAMEVRNTAHNLIPDILSRRSLPEAIRLYCEQASTPSLNIQVHIDDELPELPNKNVELMLYRITQELVQNMVKHSGATQGAIAITVGEKELIVIAEDNGSGFPTEQSEYGVGLQNIQSRVKLLQGDITIDSAPGRGTSISITFDINRLKSILSDEHQDRNNG